MVVYGIVNCDSVRKTRRWLDAHGVEYRFHDFRKDGVDRQHIESWCKKLGWETVLNRRGTTFRALAEADKQNLDEKKAISLMLARPSLIKRPVLQQGRHLATGFDEALLKQMTGA